MKTEFSPDLSICLVSRQGWETLRYVLQSFYDNSDHVSLEIFVVDLAGDLQISQKMGRTFPVVHLFEYSEVENCTVAFNMTAKLTNGRYVAFWDDDLICRPGCLAGLVSFMDDTPDAGVVGPGIISETGNTELTANRFPNLWTLLTDSLLGRDWRQIQPPLFFDAKAAQEVDWLSGPVLLLRQEAIEEVGFLDEGYGEYLSDLDWCRRAGKTGWHIHYLPQAEVEIIAEAEREEVASSVRRSLSLVRFFRKKWLGR